MIAIAAFVIVGQIILVVWPTIFRGNALGFGDGNPVNNWLVRIFPQNRPEGAAIVVEKRFQMTGRGLNHSQLYENKEVIQEIVDWMQCTH